MKKSKKKEQNHTPPIDFRTVFFLGWHHVYPYITLNLHVSDVKISYLYVSIVIPLSGEKSSFG